MYGWQWDNICGNRRYASITKCSELILSLNNSDSRVWDESYIMDEPWQILYVITCLCIIGWIIPQQNCPKYLSGAILEAEKVFRINLSDLIWIWRFTWRQIWRRRLFQEIFDQLYQSWKFWICTWISRNRYQFWGISTYCNLWKRKQS